jgi:hypothetical protein
MTHKRPRDPNKLGKLIVDVATGQTTEPTPRKLSAAAELGRKGGATKTKNYRQNKELL